MKYPVWAPADVVELHRNYVNERNAFATETHDKSDLDKHAQHMGYQHWIDFERAATLKTEIISRLLTRPEMKSFWKWLDDEDVLPHTTNGGIIGTLFRAIDDWYKVNKKTVADRTEEIRLIANHAKTLSRLLRKYHGEPQAFNSYGALISPAYDRNLEAIMRQEHLDKLATMHTGARAVWNLILPPIDEILANLADAALDCDAKLLGKYPRKIAASNALRTHLVNKMVSRFVLAANPSPAMIATFCSVALDDAAITIDTINKSEAMKEWKKALEDFG